MINNNCSVSRVMGVIRFQQTDEGSLVADGSIDGLAPGEHGLHVHETGDMSEGCASIGGHFNPYKSPHGGPLDPPDMRHAGDLGNIVADENGRATFRIVDNVLKVWDVLGRSVAVTSQRDDYGRGSTPVSKINGNSGEPIACGIIARSAGVFQNPKRICACDGVVVWDERDRPVAGKGRRCCQRDGGGDTPCCKV
ncbi:copper chaperone for superoxide dismutase [Leptidea sinapis]|uniref:copper chaperone for superoxide dismutase n=1 Tax=Leptidea sinapis TaxID=189913 RepID=UPI0021C27B98|nr:copper chaperone for superoxide dismutase [Leptidea sinapis]